MWLGSIWRNMVGSLQLHIPSSTQICLGPTLWVVSLCYNYVHFSVMFRQQLLSSSICFRSKIFSLTSHQPMSSFNNNELFLTFTKLSVYLQHGVVTQELSNDVIVTLSIAYMSTSYLLIYLFTYLLRY